ncbi:MAG TPA: choice-of-anchor Q domain-containing protein [Desulfatiglandales bacterium]|nr:choice-of-anchor Q domain-containing protein [Desulfatiglandales bacterium]
MNRTVIMSLLLLLIAARPGWAAIYYMRADGTATDKVAATGPCGQIDATMSVITHNAQSFSSGDIIYLCDNGGEYKSSIIAPSSGTDGHPITYTNAAGALPVIDLSTEVSKKGWFSLGKGKYRKSAYGRLLFEDNVPLEAATTAALTDGNWYYKIGSKVIHYKPTSGTPADHQIETLWFDTLRSTRGIDLSNKSNITVSGLTFNRCGVGVYFGQKLDSPVSLMKNITIHNNKFERVHWGILSQLVSNGIEYNVEITDNHLSYISCGISAWTHSDETPGHTQHHKGYRITGNKILNLNHISASLLWTQVWKPGYPVDHEGISFQDIQDSVISNNTITTHVVDTRDRLRAIYFFLTSGGKTATSGNSVLRNNISGVYWPAIYISAALGHAGFENNTIAYNLIYSTSSNRDYGSFKINTYSGSNPLSSTNYFVNNVIDNYVGGWAIASTSGNGGNGTWVVGNNIIKSRANVKIGLESAPGFTISHNLYPTDGPWLLGNMGLTFAGWQSMGNFDKISSRIANPLFVSSSDFHLQSSSPAIDAGMNVGISIDYDGNHVPSGIAPDMGAYEYIQAE